MCDDILVIGENISEECLLARSILQPVLKKQPVVLDILLLIADYEEKYKTGMHVNMIYKELVRANFSRNKNPVIEKISYLEKAGLLKNAPSGKQKKIKTLSPLGFELVYLAHILDGYTESCYKLQEGIKRHFDLEHYDNKKIPRSVLLNRGWKPEEIDDREMLIGESKVIAESLVSPFSTMNIMLTRYILELSKIDNNEYAKAILNEIVMGNINRQLSNMIVINIDNTYRNLIKEKIGFLTDHMEAYPYPNRFIETEVDGVLLRILMVLDVPCDILKSTMNYIDSQTEFDKDLHPERPPEGFFILSSDCRYLIRHKIYERYGLEIGIFDLELGTGHILESHIPLQIKRGSPANIFVKIVGRIKYPGWDYAKHAFLDLLFVDPDNNQLWFPDPSTWDSNTGTGKIHLKNQEYSSQWTYTIPSDSQVGEYKALILLCEKEPVRFDEDGKELGRKRRILDFQEKILYVIP